MIAFALAVGKKIDDFLDFAVTDDLAKAHDAHAVKGNHHTQAAGFDLEPVALLHRGPNGPAADLLNDSHPMVRVDHFVADDETKNIIHAESTASSRERRGRGHL